jgi:uncharacterized protein YjbI with pentapeptide repeats
MAITPKDLGELQRALNDAASKLSVLWTTFITFELYLAIAFGSVTHRDLFLETPIKLPLLNVDLPLVGFFVVAPTILVIFHFYLFLQLLAFVVKTRDYDALLRRAARKPEDRQYLRHRLDSFLVLQFLAGPREQRTGFSGFSLRLIGWLTLVGIPILILLQGQVIFLSYHREWVVWLQRIALLIDLVLVWYFWNRIRSGDEPVLGRVPSKVWPIVGAAASFFVILFSLGLATFPGEWANDHLPNVRLIPTAWPPNWSNKSHWTSLHERLFLGEIDQVSGRPGSLFSNRLVVTDQSFVDPDKLDKIDVSRSFRGRDLRGMVLTGVDLRKADFTGAVLNDASFKKTRLQDARFACAGSRYLVGCTQLQGARFTGAQLQGANLAGASLQGADLVDAELQRADLVDAELQGAHLFDAKLQGADLGEAELQGANLLRAELQGANLSDAKLQGADLGEAELQGANLLRAELQGTNLVRAKLQGADLGEAELQGAYLIDAKLQGANLFDAKLQGANLTDAELQGANLIRALVWRVRGSPHIDLTDIDQLDFDTKPWAENAGQQLLGRTAFADWCRSVLEDIPADTRNITSGRLLALDPAEEKERSDLISAEFWKRAASASPQGEERRMRLAAVLADLGCSSDTPPYVARGLLKNGRLEAAGSQVAAVADRLRKGRSDLATCPGIEGFTDQDWRDLDRLIPPKPTPAKVE